MFQYLITTSSIIHRENVFLLSWPFICHWFLPLWLLFDLSIFVLVCYLGVS